MNSESLLVPLNHKEGKRRINTVNSELLLVPLNHKEGKGKSGRPTDPHLTVDQHLRRDDNCHTIG